MASFGCLPSWWPLFRAQNIARKTEFSEQSKRWSRFRSRLREEAREREVGVFSLLGTVSHNAPITRVSKEPFIVNEPVPVEKPYNVPYEVLKHETKVVEVPTPVHVDAPYNVPVPTPVQGEPIIQKVTGPARIVHTHENRVAPAVHTGAVLGRYGGYAAAPVAAVAAPGIAAAWD